MLISISPTMLRPSNHPKRISLGQPHLKHPTLQSSLHNLNLYWPWPTSWTRLQAIHASNLAASASEASLTSNSSFRSIMSTLRSRMDR
uniref:Uncharacterized protein n=1 Tax=Arundo donax TaxID=35708 RepID=A0A0A9HMF9_ARUDO